MFMSSALAMMRECSGVPPPSPPTDSNLSCTNESRQSPHRAASEACAIADALCMLTDVPAVSSSRHVGASPATDATVTQSRIHSPVRMACLARYWSVTAST